MAVPARLTHAVASLPLTRSSAVLEIGGGPGVAAQLVLERLGPDGSYLGVDRSEVAERRTRQRCADAGSPARWDVRRGAIEDVAAMLPGAAYDLAFAVNVNVFWTSDASRLAAELHRVLHPEGSLWLFYETPTSTVGARVSDGVTRSLTGGGFDAVTAVAASPRLGAFTASRRPRGITNR
ncbi:MULTISPECIES: class I SAM-dependent methyltransferase [Mumia]|uniref:class I SAM-dependent methyltransferase n=1 Tax=Mumia TaxID=1546255 RepID=UPI00142355D8|nr:MULTISPECIES: class I SAM-dependent methyltransferase [unclassified Mumia]QMW67545.1 class I SAM-dependent methyltransferase [Mumia sp. ZJ1417]